VFSILLHEGLINLELVQKILRWQHTGFHVHSQVRARSKEEADKDPTHLPLLEHSLQYVPRKGWAEMIRKLYELDPLLCPKCGGRMRIIAFIKDYAVIDKIINHLKLAFMAERPPPPQAQPQLSMATEERDEYF